MVKKKENKIITQDSHGDKVVVIHTYPRFFDWLGNVSITVSDNKYIKWVFLALLAALAVIQNPQSSGGDYDFFFHLKYGEIYLKNLTWKLDHSQFSWTPSMADWPYVTWLGNILIYLFYNIASGNGVLILQWSVYLGVFFMLVKYIHAAGDRLDITYILLAFITITALSLVDIFIKPDLLTTLFFGLSVFIYIYTKTTGRNLFYFYPVLFLLWVNTHGGFVNGLIFISLALLGELVNHIFFKKAALNKRLSYSFLISVCLSYAATLINPYGIKYHAYLFENLFSKEAYESLAKPLFAYISLWKHIFSTQAYKFTNGAWSLLFMECVVVCLFVYGLAKKKIFDFSLVLSTTAFFFFSMGMARAVKFFPILCFFVIIYLIKLTGLQEAKKKLGVIILVIFLLLAGRITYQSFWYSSELPSWNHSKLINETPQDVVRFVKANKLQGPIFNDYLVGGYLLWALYPDYKVFIDSRQGPYAKHIWPDFQKYANTAPFTPEKLREFTAKYPFKIAIIHYAYFSEIQWLLNSPDWKLLYFDRVAAVIIHKSVVPTLSKQALSTEAGTVRFLDVTRSDILLNLFNFYVHVGPKFARDIIEIYRRNVNDIYVFKEQNIQQMEQALQQKLMQLEQQQQIQEQIQKQQMTK